MTRHESFSETTDIAAKEMVLATDLDGTFLGGSADDRHQFYAWIEANRGRVGLIFVTGREPGFIANLSRKQGVPRPDYCVADVGTTIAEVGDDHHLRPIAALEDEIARLWNNSGGLVEAALSRITGLKLQSTGFRHRVSYDIEPDRFDRRALDVIAELGHDALISDNRFLDVLPKGVSKGPSLLNLLTHLGVDNRRVLVAGDTLNDLSMLKLGLPAVAVGKSEPALIAALEGRDHVHFAEAEGVAGIAEAILAHGLMQKKS